jgi:hypothetical protein
MNSDARSVPISMVAACTTSWIFSACCRSKSSPHRLRALH